MPPTIPDKLVVAISSRALFDLDESHRVFVEEGIDAYLSFLSERTKPEPSPKDHPANVQLHNAQVTRQLLAP